MNAYLVANANAVVDILDLFQCETAPLLVPLSVFTTVATGSTA